MSKKSNDSKTKTYLEYFNNSDLATKDINEVTTLLLDSHKTFNGRQFINDDELKYVLPSDKKEIERSTLAHLLNRHRWKGNFSSPIKEKLDMCGATILDVGCGPGLRVIDMGLEYPYSSIIGLDIDSSAFPPRGQYPSNVCFLTSNATHGVPFPPNTFDFIHMSMMWGAFNETQWISIIKDLVRVLKHDGWIEFTEPDVTPKNPGKIQLLIHEYSRKACRELKGVNIAIYEMIPKYLKAMDELENINCITIDYPIGEWYGCFGKYAAENIKRVYQSFVFLPKYMGISNEEYIDLLNDFVKEANEYKSYHFVCRYFARKKSSNY
ncbi:71_t:CDS:2 [Scutellospora calospora]|uniref:71_t:CDS:1 n=1 Tax=Scutellospora calospora TaxID=85575 RepID=A0ACA9LE64_9GLOM|nr:71_t:CDS:2 [Scutellospora calospora]